MRVIEANVEGLAEAVRALKAGEVVAVINETVYGLACDAANGAACDSVCELKGRKGGHTLPIQVADLNAWHIALPPAASNLFDRFAPGPITVIVPGDPALAAQTRGENGTAGLRIPAHPVMHSLLVAFGAPLACTSANPTGEPPAEDIGTVRRYFEGRVRLALTGEPATQGLSSTVVDATTNPPTILREGTIEPEEITRCLQDLPGSL